ncbi:uncharacterized protein V6R79_009686 [Siganus canaliculatus]
MKKGASCSGINKDTPGLLQHNNQDSPEPSLLKENLQLFFIMNRLVFVLLSLSLFAAASSLSCKWMDDKFRDFSEKYLKLLHSMANNSTNSTEDSETFPEELYSRAFNASILTETVVLFEEDRSSASWEEKTMDKFLMDVTRQAEGLCSCIGSHGHKKKNKKLHMHFKGLSNRILKEMGHSAEAWELIRKQIETHLMRVDLLLKPLGKTE